MQLQKILLSIFFACSLMPSQAQPPAEKQRAIALLQSVAQHYLEHRGLQFSMNYRYANERQPTLWLDSLKGYITIDSNLYRYSLDSTEFIGGTDVSVILFKQDQLMYLTKGNNALPQINPMTLMDSMLLRNDNVDGRVQDTKDRQIVTLSFHPVQRTKQIEYVIDKATGYIVKMTIIVSARELYDPSVQQKVEDDNTYAIVETRFSDYRLTDVTNRGWDPSRLFKKEGTEYIPLPPYDHYKIVLGSPDL